MGIGVKSADELTHTVSRIKKKKKEKAEEAASGKKGSCQCVRVKQIGALKGKQKGAVGETECLVAAKR